MRHATREMRATSRIRNTHYSFAEGYPTTYLGLDRGALADVRHMHDRRAGIPEIHRHCCGRAIRDKSQLTRAAAWFCSFDDQDPGKYEWIKSWASLFSLAIASALLSCAALLYEQRLATFVFAALTCTILHHHAPGLLI